jgi:peptidoglycan/LPS O-acetylase OafA/YrhL
MAGAREFPAIAPTGRAHLNLIRGGAAASVLLSHALLLAGRPNRLGHVAVIAFFVLSGFLVATSTFERPGFRRYTAARASRILTVFWPALALGAVLDLIGMRVVRAAAYANVQLSPAVALKNAVFLQSIHAPVLGTNSPLWTLAYEGWFYVAFPFVMLLLAGSWTRRLLSIAVLALVTAIAGRYVLATMSVWLLGVVVAALREKNTRRAVEYGVIAALLFFAAADDPVFTRSLAIDGALGIGFALVIAFLAGRAGEVPRVYDRVASAVAEVSYSLYLVHVPALVLLTALGLGWVGAPVAVLYATAVWFVFERRTPAVRAFLMRV